MRKIESDMLKAIYSGNHFAKDNTRVEITDTRVEVYLHGNHIASVESHPLSGHFTVKANIDTLFKYPTRTTLSRLRALGVDVCIRKGEVILYGEPL